MSMLSVELPGSVGAGSVGLSAVGDDRVGSGAVGDGAVVGESGTDCVGPGVSTSSAPQLARTSTNRPAVVVPRIRRDQRDLAADRASYTWGTLSSPPTTFVESCSRGLSSCNGATLSSAYRFSGNRSQYRPYLLRLPKLTVGAVQIGRPMGWRHPCARDELRYSLPSRWLQYWQCRTTAEPRQRRRVRAVRAS
jgi:hypothetical protein